MLMTDNLDAHIDYPKPGSRFTRSLSLRSTGPYIMQRKIIANVSNKPKTLPQQNGTIDNSVRDPALDELLKNVNRLLQADAPAKALELITKSKIKSPGVKNATAVCQLRLGKAQVAIDIYRSFLLNRAIYLRADSPVIYRINFGVALFLNNNLPGVSSLLFDLRDETHPSLEKLRAAVAAWKKKLTIWQRLQLIFGSHPAVPIELGYPPGDLE